MIAYPIRTVFFVVAFSGAYRADLLAAESMVRVGNQAQLAAALSAAKPGTTILIAPGKYSGGLSRRELRGTELEPITIAAADPLQPPVIEGGSGGLHLSDPEYIELKSLVISGAAGNGLNIDDGGSKDSPAHHVKLVDLVVRDIGPRGNRDGIKLSGLDDFTVENCTIERWGSSGSAIDMVGCHRGEVTRCTFRHEGADSANGVQTKGGSSDIRVHHCRFENSGGRAVNVGGSTGLEYFRPKPQGYEAKNITVEDCTFIGSMVPIAFVGVDGALVRHNTIYRPKRWGIRILQETQAPEFVPCRNGKFEQNIIAFRSDEVATMVSSGPGTAPETFSFTSNHWYCIDSPTTTQNLIRLPATEKNGSYGVDPEFVNAEQGNLRVRDLQRISAGVRDSQENTR